MLFLIDCYTLARLCRPYLALAKCTYYNFTSYKLWQKKRTTERRFRSSDLWVMGPARFLCATPV